MSVAIKYQDKISTNSNVIFSKAVPGDPDPRHYPDTFEKYCVLMYSVSNQLIDVIKEVDSESALDSAFTTIVNNIKSGYIDIDNL